MQLLKEEAGSLWRRDSKFVHLFLAEIELAKRLKSNGEEGVFLIRIPVTHNNDSAFDDFGSLEEAKRRIKEAVEALGLENVSIEEK